MEAVLPRNINQIYFLVLNLFYLRVTNGQVVVNSFISLYRLYSSV